MLKMTVNILRTLSKQKYLEKETVGIQKFKIKLLLLENNKGNSLSKNCIVLH